MVLPNPLELSPSIGGGVLLLELPEMVMLDGLVRSFTNDRNHGKKSYFGDGIAGKRGAVVVLGLAIQILETHQHADDRKHNVWLVKSFLYAFNGARAFKSSC